MDNMENVQSAESTKAPKQEAEHSLAHMPISFFSVVMGMAGVTIAWEKGQQMYNIDLGILNGLLITITALIFAALAAMYIQKIVKFPDHVSAELNHPVKLSFFPTIAISFLLLSIALVPISPIIAKSLWAIGTTSQLGFVLYIVGMWMHQEHFQVPHMSPAWFIPAVGNVIVPITGMQFGLVELSWFFFSIGIMFWVILMTIVFYRILFHTPIPARLLPTLFILIAPPAVGFVAYMSLTGELDSFARILYNAGLFLTLLLFTQFRRFTKLPFYLSWWAYSFPIAAITIATMVMYQHTQKAAFMWLSSGLLVFVTVLVGMLLVRTGIAMANHEICVEEG